jgi:murein L,D-transpeptidase YafK
MAKRKTIWLTVCFVWAGLLIYCFYPENSLPDDIQIDNIIVYKSKKTMQVYANGTLQKTYKIALGSQPVGHKIFEGDKKTPEGVYFINDKNPDSGYHKNLGISYPNKNDLENARQLGKSAGGNIKIHGLKNGIGFAGKFHRWFATSGCIRVTDNEMDELYRSVKIGTGIEIKP